METTFKLIVGIAGGAVSFLFGGWDSLLTILFVLVLIDYGTGMIASTLAKELNSKVGWGGIPRKVLIFVMVVVAQMVDVVLRHYDLPFPVLLRDATIFFYMTNEILSIIENVGRSGLPVPEKLADAIEVLKGKGKG